MILRDDQGRTIELGAELGRGGEGVVYALPAWPDRVAKRYHEAPDARRARKLAAMASLSTEALARVAAWPSGCLRRSDGGVAGFVMPRIDGHKNVHLLYGPRSRAKEFPAASYAFLVRAALNLCRAFAVVHEHGHVVGDVNDKIAMVSPQATVTLVDCDSFQVRHEAELLSCDVGVLTHQPPELQGVETFRALPRTARHDAFGLAVVVFQLLFLARHPFSGAFVGDGEMTIPRAIRESRFVYGAGAAAAGMQPPPFSLPLAAVGPRVSALFERAFARPAAERPTASEWVDALEAMERSLQACAHNPRHQRVDAQRPCPLCEVEMAAGVALFGLSPKVGDTPAELADLWAEVERLKAPGRAPLPAVTTPAQERSSLSREVAEAKEQRTFLRAGLVLTTLGLAAVGLGFVQPALDVAALALVTGLWRFTGVQRTVPWKDAARVFADAEKRWQEVADAWAREADAEPFTRKRAELAAMKKEVEALEAARDPRRVQVLRAMARGVAELRAIGQTIEARRRALEPEAREAGEALARARRDLDGV